MARILLMRRGQQRLPLMLVAALLLIVGAIRMDEGGLDGWALLSAGLVTLGAWIATETTLINRSIEEEKDGN